MHGPNPLPASEILVIRFAFAEMSLSENAHYSRSSLIWFKLDNNSTSQLLNFHKQNTYTNI